MIPRSLPVARRRPHPAARSALTALAVLAAGSAMVAPSAQASPAEPAVAPQQVQVAAVYAASAAVESGTTVRTSTVVRSTSGTRQPARTLRLYLAGGARTYALDVVRTPSLAPGQRATVRTTGAAPLSAPAGRYAVRACLGPLGAQVCRTSETTVVVGQARLTADPAVLNFDEVPVGAASETRPLEITNAGHARTGFLRTEVTGPDAADFFVADGTCDVRLAPGSVCGLQVTFAPQAEPGTSSATLIVGDGAAAVSVPLSGEAGARSPIEIDPASSDYGDVPVGGSVTQTFRVVNTSDAAVVTGGLIGDGQDPNFAFDFSGSFTCLEPVAAGESCTVSVSFSPTTTGRLSSSLVIFADGEVGATADLTGTGTPGATSGRPAAPQRAGAFGVTG